MSPVTAKAIVNGKPFGRIYGSPDTPSFVTQDGVPLWMWRKGQKVRFFTASGAQVGPEHCNVAPAMSAAFAAGWNVPSVPDWLNDGCQRECGYQSSGM
jgi:hypothetical protein